MTGKSVWFTPAQEEIIACIDGLAGDIRQAAANGNVRELDRLGILLRQETNSLGLQRALDGETD